MRAQMRSISPRASSRNSVRNSSSARRSGRSWMKVRTETSGLRISCATPAASMPRAESRSARPSSSRVCRSSAACRSDATSCASASATPAASARSAGVSGAPPARARRRSPRTRSPAPTGRARLHVPASGASPGASGAGGGWPCTTTGTGAPRGGFSTRRAARSSPSTRPSSATSDSTAAEDSGSSPPGPGLRRPTKPPTPPASGRPPDRCANLSALYAPGAGKSIRAGSASRGARRAHPHAQHAEREEEGPERAEEPPGPQQELVESELGERQLVALVALARRREERGRIGRQAGRRCAAQDLLVLHDLGAAGDDVAEPDREQEKARQVEPAAHERVRGEGRGRRHGAASSACSGNRSRWRPAPRGAELADGVWGARRSRAGVGAQRAQRASSGRAPRRWRPAPRGAELADGVWGHRSSAAREQRTGPQECLGYGMGMDDSLLESLDAGVLTLTLNRPARRNALDEALITRLHRRLAAASDDAAVRAVVLTGAGGAFSSGADLKEAATALTGDLIERGYNPVIRAIRRMPKPVIAAVDGVATGYGASLALAADIRLASERARLSLIFVRVGLTLDGGASWFLPRLVGLRAYELAMTGELVDAAEAYRIGLVNHVYPEARFAATVAAFAHRLADGPPLALQAIQANLNASLGPALESIMEDERIAQRWLFTTADVREGVTAFIEKRPARFTGE